MIAGGASTEDLGRQGIAALQSGDAATARAVFRRVIDAGGAPPQFRLLLGESCRRLGDPEGEACALDELLVLEPYNIAALLMRADLYARQADRRAAASFYQAALSAAANGGQVAPALRPSLERAAAFLREASASYQAHLERSLAERQVDPAVAGRRLGEALDILFGRKEVCLQQPSVFYFPGLPQIAFYEREEFEWAAEVEAAAPAIKAELLALLRDGADFQPYVEQEKDRPFREFHGMTGDPSWSAFYLWQNGDLVQENARRCPTTVAALERVPMTRMGARTPSVLFSLLRPGAHIPPHHGMLNTRLICHLPLVVPEGCWLRVGNETRQWEEGKLLIFDDSIVHEARNPTGETRIILLFDIWRPELDGNEQQAVSAIFEAIDAYGGVPPHA
jgi:tetratricopeptide (TPR) repeat protein